LLCTLAIAGQAMAGKLLPLPVAGIRCRTEGFGYEG
jgi:hypothetical protein